MSKTRNQNETIVIFGTGPTGLATAIETAKHASPNQKIVIITNRITHERNPIFRLNDQTYEYLQQLVGNDIFSQYSRTSQIHHVTPEQNIYDEESYYEIQIKSLETMLHEKLNEYLNSINIITLQPKETVEIATDTAEVLLSDGKRIPFHYLIAADGAHHHIANQFIDQGFDLTYLATQQRQLHSFHAIGCYQTPGKYGTRKYHKLLQSFQDDENKLAKLLTDMQQSGWKLSSFPESRIFIVNNTLYIGAEAPKHKLFSDAATDEWLRHVLKGSLPDEEVDQLKLSGITNHGANCSTFNITLEEADRVFVSLKVSDQAKLGYFIQLGDALRTPHYHTGSGAIIGLMEAKAWGEFMASPQTAEDVTALSKHIQQILQDNREKVDKYLELRQQREREAKTKKRLVRFSSASSLFKLDNTLTKRLRHSQPEEPRSSNTLSIKTP